MTELMNPLPLDDIEPQLDERNGSEDAVEYGMESKPISRFHALIHFPSME